MYYPSMTLLRCVCVLAFLGVVHGQGRNEVRATSVSELVSAVRDLRNGQSIVVDAPRLELTEALTITARNVELRGGVDGATLVCPDSNAALFVSSGNARVIDLQFVGCRVESAVVVEGRNQRNVNASFRRVIFRNNQIQPSNRSFVLGEPNPLNAALLLRRCRVEPCEADVTVELEECTFVSNSADSGGAILGTDVALTIRNSTFDRNRARSTGGAVHVTGPRSIVEMDGCRWTRNAVIGSGSSRPIVERNGAPLESSAYVRFLFPSASGGAIHFGTVSSVALQNCDFTSNSAPAGGAIALIVDRLAAGQASLSLDYNAQLTGCTFDRNRASFSDEVDESTIADAPEFNLGGALYVVSNSPELSLVLEECVWTRNSARFGGALNLVTRVETAPEIRRSRFSENRATISGGAILLRNSGPVDIRETNCTDNFALFGGCVMLTNDARLTVTGPAGIPPNREGESSFFVNNSALQGGAIMCVECGEVVLREPFFINNTAMLNGGALFLLDTENEFRIEQAIFDSNLALRGGGLAIEAAGNVRVTGNVGLISRFIGNKAVTGAAIHAAADSHRENRFEIENSIFETNNATTIDALLQEHRFNVTRDRILASQNFLMSEEDLEIERSIAIATCGEGGGGAICLVLNGVPTGAVADYIVTDILVHNNSAVVGGGIFAVIDGDAAWNAGDLDLSGRCPSSLLVQRCRSFRFINVTITENTASAGAGGIFISDPNSMVIARQCNLRSGYQSLLETMVDGAIGQDAEVCSTIENNRVMEGGFGPNGGALADRLVVAENARVIVNHTGGELLRADCENCSADSDRDVRISVVDSFGQVITGGVSDASLSVSLVSDNIFGERIYMAERGVVNVNNTEGTGIGKEDAVVRIEAVGNRSLATEIQFSLRECFPGEEEGDLRCVPCRPLQYAFSAASPGCLPCEDHAICSGGAALVPVEGFWHSTPFSPQFHECIVRSACRYSNRISALTAYYADRSSVQEEIRLMNETIAAGDKPTFPTYEQCATGYTGILCGACERGYGHFAGGECVECPTGKAGSVLISIAISIWMAFFVGANIFTTLSSTHRQIRLAVFKLRTAKTGDFQLQGPSPTLSEEIQEVKEEDSSCSMDNRITASIKLTEMLKILVNYLQVTSVALSINVNWIGLIEAMLSVELLLMGVTSGSYFVPLDCTFDQKEQDPEDVPNSVKVLWIRATFPLVLLSFFVIVCWLYTMHKRRNSPPNARAVGQNRAYSIQGFVTFKSYCIVISIVIAFFSYINVTSEFMRAINCIEVDEKPNGDASTKNLYNVYAIETGDRVWAEDTSLYCFRGDHTLTGVFGILGLIFFSIAVIVFILTWLPLNAARLGDPEFISQYGFIYQGYREIWYVTFWEAVITIRKGLIAAAVVYAFPLGPNLQGVCAMGVLILAIALHFIFRPFKPFHGQPNVPEYAGSTLRKLKLTKLADSWVGFNNMVSLNALEAASLLMSLVVFYSGILFNDENASTEGKYTMAAFTFAVNISFIVYVLYRLYYGAHVALNLYCHHLKLVDPARKIPEGIGMICLVKKGILVFRHRSAFHASNGVTVQRSDNPLDEHV